MKTVHPIFLYLSYRRQQLNIGIYYVIADWSNTDPASEAKVLYSKNPDTTKDRNKWNIIADFLLKNSARNGGLFLLLKK